MTIWVLTSEYNDYDQREEYFVHAWNHKPQLSELEAQNVPKMGQHCPYCETPVGPEDV